jgi:tetratricopeptide (TPR) repeat protein
MELRRAKDRIRYAAFRQLALGRELSLVIPDCANAYHWYSHFHVSTGQIEKSLAVCEQCLALAPLNVIHSNHLGWHFYHLRQYDAALAQSLKTLELDPHSVWPHCELGRAYEQKQMYAEAIEFFKQATGISRSSFPVAGLGHAYALAGRRDEAMKQLEELSRCAAEGYVSSFNPAVIYAGLGDRALDLLETAYEERSGWMACLKVDPRLAPLRAEPRFIALLQRVGLEVEQ